MIRVSFYYYWILNISGLWMNVSCKYVWHSKTKALVMWETIDFFKFCFVCFFPFISFDVLQCVCVCSRTRFWGTLNIQTEFDKDLEHIYFIILHIHWQTIPNLYGYDCLYPPSARFFPSFFSSPPYQFVSILVHRKFIRAQTKQKIKPKRTQVVRKWSW